VNITENRGEHLAL